VNLEINAGEFMVLLGPSGCGKSTILRMIAGLEEATSGEVLLDGVSAENLTPRERGIAMVFQDFALYPHMTVGENIGFPLKITKVEQARRADQVVEVASALGIGELLARFPSQLSGGQRQRVAMGRAIVRRPRVFLMDEPLSNLDSQLRAELRAEISALMRELEVTCIYVTHDQGEALTMSDRIAVFNRGRIEQVGSPAEVYEHPATPFVAGFVGTSNLLTGAVARAVLGVDGMFSVRPEKIRLDAEGGRRAGDEVAVDGTLAEVTYAGPATRFHVDIDAGVRLVALAQNLDTGPSGAAVRPGQRVRLAWRRQHVFRIPAPVPDGAAPDGAALDGAALDEHTPTDRQG
jgi:putative spermidine/putrescine transport system ATP-binding protein